MVPVPSAHGSVVQAVVKETVLAAAAVAVVLVIEVLLAKAFNIHSWLFKNNIKIHALHPLQVRKDNMF